MPKVERMTVTLPHDVADLVKGAVESGDYASSSEVVREALRYWELTRALRVKETEALKADVAQGLDDLAEGRVQDFDVARITEQGRTRLNAR